MRVTILGSSGQIGAYLTEYLRKKGHEVTEFDKNHDGVIDYDEFVNIMFTLDGSVDDGKKVA